MTRALAVILALVLALLGWQSWRLNNADHTIGTQAEALKKNKQELAKKNSQLISLSILTETNSRAQMQLYAAAEETSSLLRSRQIYAVGLTLLCLLTLSGCGNARPSPEVQLTVSGCPKVTQCRLDRSAPRSNGDLNQVLDETEAAWAVCADKVDTIIACQERDSEQAAVLTQRPE